MKVLIAGQCRAGFPQQQERPPSPSAEARTPWPAQPLWFVLPASGTAPRPSSPSSGKAPLPEKAAPAAGKGPAAPHGTWEIRPAVPAENRTGSPAQQGECRQARLPSPLRSGLIPSLAQVWAVLPLGQAEVWPALAKQASSKPRWQVFPILLQDKGSKAAPNRDALGRTKRHFVIQPRHLNPQSRSSLRVPAT